MAKMMKCILESSDVSHIDIMVVRNQNSLMRYTPLIENFNTD
jgi:hypothetical protein